MKTEKLIQIQKKRAFHYIDPKFTLELWQEGEDFARQVIQLYIESLSELSINCHKIISKQDYEALEFVIHQLKPNLIRIEASYLLSLLEKLKNSLDSQNIGTLHKIFTQIEKTIIKIQEELKHFI